MDIISFKILNQGPLQLQLPGSLLIRTQTNWIDDILKSVDGTISYSIKGNTSNVRFSDGSDMFVVKHTFHPKVYNANDTLHFIRQENNAPPSNQFSILATVKIEKKKSTDTISVNLH